MLAKLVRSIVMDPFDRDLIKDVFIVIVDNDKEKGAEAIVSELLEFATDSFHIDYHHYPLKGLSNVRNELLRRAYILEPDYIVFVDDDEFVSKGWLNEFVGGIVAGNGDLAMGPVISEFEGEVPDNISCWFKGELYDRTSKCNPDAVSTANLILNAHTLAKHKIWFDGRFNITGAEDSYFGKQLINEGARCCWINGALVYETVPRDRSNISWLIKRYFNGANKYMYILSLEKQYTDIIRKVFISFFYLISGILSVPAILLPVKKKYWGILKFSEGIGAIAGLLSIKYYEYK